MKKIILAAAAALAAVVPAQAISRYNSEEMSCRQAQATIVDHGAVILRWRSASNPSLTRYDRYVAHSGYCQSSEYARAAWIPTADTRQCPVYVCKERDYDRRFWRD